MINTSIEQCMTLKCGNSHQEFSDKVLFKGLRLRRYVEFLIGLVWFKSIQKNFLKVVVSTFQVWM
ncbi:hypothetical protein AMR47_16935 [Leptospira interrogans]|nr:hypothetical protein AMR47_16935 [Leptospira interrogans]